MSFRHHPDGIIYLGDLQLPLDRWLQLEPTYSLPEGATGREYAPGEKHLLYNGSDQWGGEFPWQEGDRYLASVEYYQAAIEDASPPEPARTRDWGRLENSLRGTPIFAKAFGTQNGNAWSLLLSTITRQGDPNDPGRLSDFVFAIAQIRLGLFSDFSPEEVAQFNQLLGECGFDYQVPVERGGPV